MDKYIRKQDAIDAIHEFPMFMECDEIYIYQKRIEKISAADVAPVVHGKWIGYDDTERFTAQCSLCGNVIDTRFGSNFCPNCGAKMDIR